MTTLVSESQVCDVCGTSVVCEVLGSSNEFGNRDLDLRPAEMLRSTMPNWLQECPECRYVNSNLTKSTANARAAIDSEAFQSLLDDSERLGLADRFARYSLLQSVNAEIAGKALLHAAWVCDDAEDAEQARSYRNQAADLLLALQPFADEDGPATVATVLIDVLRRAGRFDESKRLATTLRTFQSVREYDMMGSVLEYEAELCEAADESCHNLADITIDHKLRY